MSKMEELSELEVRRILMICENGARMTCEEDQAKRYNDAERYLGDSTGQERLADEVLAQRGIERIVTYRRNDMAAVASPAPPSAFAAIPAEAGAGESALEALGS